MVWAFLLALALTVAHAQEAPETIRVTWQQALDRAAARNPSAYVAQQEIARADALVREARAGWLPILTGNGSYVRLDSARTFAGTVTTPIAQWNGNIQLTLPLVTPSAWANDWHAQDNRALATASAADVRRQLATAVGRVYLTVLLQHRQVEVVARALDTARSHYDYAHTRLGLGLGNGVDDARAEQELRTDEAELKDADTALVRAQSALATLLSEEDLVDVADAFDLATAPAEATALDTARRPKGGRACIGGTSYRQCASPARRMGLLRSVAAGASPGVQGDRNSTSTWKWLADSCCAFHSLLRRGNALRREQRT